MSKKNIVTLLGVLVILAPFIGLPYSWLMVLLPLLGIGIVVTAFLMRRKDTTPTVTYDQEPPAVV